MGYKAFEKGMICRGKQYAENTVYEEKGANACCEAGVMHYCDEPFEVWDYYPIVDDKGNFTEYAEVEPLDKVLKNGNKRATKKLRIGAKLSLKDIIKEEIDFIFAKSDGKNVAKGYSSSAASQGYSSSAASQGNYSRAAAIGQYSIAAGLGIKNKAMSKAGSWIVLAEWERDDDGIYKPICVKSAQIDGETLKPDTWYMLKNGEFTEVADDDE